MQGQWLGQWSGDWLGSVEGGNPVVIAGLVVAGSSTAVFSAEVVNREVELAEIEYLGGAPGKKRLRDYAPDSYMARLFGPPLELKKDVEKDIDLIQEAVESGNVGITQQEVDRQLDLIGINYEKAYAKAYAEIYRLFSEQQQNKINQQRLIDDEYEAVAIAIAALL